MHARNPKLRKGQDPSPLHPLSADAAIPPKSAPQSPDKGLSAAFAAALGAGAPTADTAGAGHEKTKGGHGRPDQTNKAAKPATRPGGFSGHRSGHR
jgi:hypothetical protein